jgi:hypothetical protein
MLCILGIGQIAVPSLIQYIILVISMTFNDTNIQHFIHFANIKEFIVLFQVYHYKHSFSFIFFTYHKQNFIPIL